MKKKFLSLVCALLTAALLLAGCGASVTSKSTVQAKLDAIAALGQSPDDAYRTWYEIFVYSFCDSDGDGIGDLKGVESKLDYLQQLGITGIWLMPISPSQSYHKYDVRDYYEIDPQYGTMEDFDSLLAACHEKGIHLIIDLVVNHSGDDNKWFLDACEYLKTVPATETPDPAVCPSVEYYFFEPTGSVMGAYNAIEGTEWSYECQFSPDMPDLNWGSSAMRGEVKKVMEFWLNKGVDGFRLDAAKEFYSGNVDKNIEVLNWLQNTAVSIKPDAYLVAEVWESYSNVKRYYTSGITSIFDFPYGNSTGVIMDTVRAAGNAASVAKFANNQQTTDSGYRAANPNYIGAPFLSNHDVGRIGSFLSGNANEIKMASAMNIFMSGGCFIYYGEELGMPGSGNDPSKRAPMLWDVNGTPDTTGLPPECTLPESYPLGGLAQQEAQEDSVYNYYRQAIAIRNALPAVARGEVTAEEELNKNCVSAVRKTWGDQSCILLYNVNEEAAQVDLSGYADWQMAVSLDVAAESCTLKDGTLTMPAWSIAVLTPAA